MEFEYRSIIEIDRNISTEKLKRISRIIEVAFDNRAGTVKNISEDSYVFIFEGNEPEWDCLMLGNLAIGKNKEVFPTIASWKWFDNDKPDTSEDIIKSYLEVGIKHGW